MPETTIPSTCSCWLQPQLRRDFTNSFGDLNSKQISKPDEFYDILVKGNTSREGVLISTYLRRF